MGSKGGTTKIVTPSASETAEAQTQANIDAIGASAAVNRYNEVTPWGSVSWTRPESAQPAQAVSNASGYAYSGATPGIGRYGTNLYNTQGYNASSSGSSNDYSDLGGWTRTTTLSPEMQQQFDLQNQLAQSLGQNAATRAQQLGTDQYSISGNLPGMVSSLDTSGLPQMTGGLDTSGLPDINQDYSQDASRVEQATYDRLQQLMNPQYEERQRALEAQLAATGNPLGSEGYMTEQDRFQRQRDEADLAAALESVGAGRAEQSRLFDIASRARGQLTGEQATSNALAQAARQQGISEQMTNADLARVARQQGIDESLTERNQRLNELSALIQGSPAIQTPTSAEPAQYQIAPADYIGAQQLATNAQLQNAATQAQANSAKKGGTTGLIGNLGSAAIQAYSDSRLKTNIKPAAKIGSHTYYSFEWNERANELGLYGSDFGVMADEIEQYMPELVSIDQKTGYKMVDYGGLH